MNRIERAAAALDEFLNTNEHPEPEVPRAIGHVEFSELHIYTVSSNGVLLEKTYAHIEKLSERLSLLLNKLDAVSHEDRLCLYRDVTPWTIQRAREFSDFLNGVSDETPFLHFDAESMAPANRVRVNFGTLMNSPQELMANYAFFGLLNDPNGVNVSMGNLVRPGLTFSPHVIMRTKYSVDELAPYLSVMRFFRHKVPMKMANSLLTDISVNGLPAWELFDFESFCAIFTLRKKGKIIVELDPEFIIEGPLLDRFFGSRIAQRLRTVYRARELVQAPAAKRTKVE